MKLGLGLLSTLTTAVAGSPEPSHCSNSAAARPVTKEPGGNGETPVMGGRIEV